MGEEKEANNKGRPHTQGEGVSPKSTHMNMRGCMDLILKVGPFLSIMRTSLLDGQKERGDGKGGEGEREGDVGHRGHIVTLSLAMSR